MRNKSKKFLATLLICMAGLSFTCVAVNNGEEKCTSLIIDGGKKTVGREDASYQTMEEYGTDAEIYACIEDGYFSTPVIEKILNDGRCLGYVDQLKAEGWIPQDFTPAGSQTSNTSSTEAKTETPAETQMKQVHLIINSRKRLKKTISLKQRQRQRKSQRRKKLMQHGKKQREWKRPAQRMVRSFIPIPLPETQKKNLSLLLVMIMK